MKSWRVALLSTLALVASACGGGGGGGEKVVAGPLEGIWSGGAAAVARVGDASRGAIGPELRAIRIGFTYDGVNLGAVVFADTSEGLGIGDMDSGGISGNLVDFAWSDQFGSHTFEGEIPEGQTLADCSRMDATITYAGTVYNVVLFRRGANNPADVDGFYLGTASSTDSPGAGADLEVSLFQETNFVEGIVYADGFYGEFSAGVEGNRFVTGEFLFETGEGGFWEGTITEDGKFINGTYQIFSPSGTRTDRGTFQLERQEETPESVRTRKPATGKTWADVLKR